MLEPSRAPSGTPIAALELAMTDYAQLPLDNDDGSFNVVVETPRGSTAKMALDPKHGVFVYRRPLPLGLAYPFDFGFFRSTLGDDGDPLDAMIVFDASTWPGVMIACRPIGVVRVTQREKGKSARVRNDRVFVVPVEDARYEDVDDLPKQLRAHLEKFFVLATMNTPKHVRIEGWSGARAAKKLIAEAARRLRAQP